MNAFAVSSYLNSIFSSPQSSGLLAPNWVGSKTQSDQGQVDADTPLPWESLGCMFLLRSAVWIITPKHILNKAFRGYFRLSPGWRKYFDLPNSGSPARQWSASGSSLLINDLTGRFSTPASNRSVPIAAEQISWHSVLSRIPKSIDFKTKTCETPWWKMASGAW